MPLRAAVRERVERDNITENAYSAKGETVSGKGHNVEACWVRSGNSKYYCVSLGMILYNNTGTGKHRLPLRYNTIRASECSVCRDADMIVSYCTTTTTTTTTVRLRRHYRPPLQRLPLPALLPARLLLSRSPKRKTHSHKRRFCSSCRCILCILHAALCNRQGPGKERENTRDPFSCAARQAVKAWPPFVHPAGSCPVPRKEVASGVAA